APKTPDDLAKHDCLEYTYFESRGEWRLLDPHGKEIVVPVSGRYLANNADVLRTTAIAGGGIILLPTFIIGEDLRAGRLVRLLGRLSAAGAGAACALSARPASLGQSKELCGFSG